MLDEEKLLHKGQIQQMNVYKEDRVENVYAYAMQQQFHENEILQKSKFNFKDSKQMQDVKLAMEQITNKMQETIPQEDKEELRTQFASLTEAYANLIRACQNYLEGHPHPRTIAGKARKRLVNGTLTMAKKEAAGLSNALLQLKPYFRNGEPLLWGNVLGIIRGVSFDLNDKIEISSEGASTSELKVLKTADDKTYFYKEDEKLATPREALVEEYKGLKKTEEKKILENLLQLFDYQVERKQDKFGNVDTKYHHAKMDDLFAMPEGVYIPPVLSELKQKNTKEVRTKVEQYIQNLNMPSLELNLKEKKTWKLFQDIMPKYWRLRTRLGVSAEAGIGHNQSLSQRNVAASRMAAVFGMPSLVVATNKATLFKDGKKMEEGNGIVMSKAKGSAYGDVWQMAKQKKESIIYTPEAMRQISCLQLFDSICGQIDRHWNNIFASYKEENGKIIITGFQGIDNDLSFGDLMYQNIKNGINRLPAFEDDNFYSNMSFLDAKMVETMRALKKTDLTYYLGDLLESKYIDAMWNRMENMLKVIDKSLYKSEHHKPRAALLDEDAWKSDFVKENFLRLNPGYLE